MIINRKDIHCFARIAKKLIESKRRADTAVHFLPHKKGVQMVLQSFEGNLLSYTIPDIGKTAIACRLPFQLIEEIGARKSGGTVVFCVEGDQAQVRWQEAVESPPYTRTVAMPKIRSLPVMPKPSKWVRHPSELLFDALADALLCVSRNNVNVSLKWICFRGTSILASDGKQALIQEGFLRLFAKDKLCLPSKIFMSKEMRSFDSSVKVGATADYMCFEIGPVRFCLRSGKATYPDFERFRVNVTGWTHLCITKADAKFLAEYLRVLPGKGTEDDPVSFELSPGRIPAIRGYDVCNTKTSAVELRLVNSAFEGRYPIQVTVRRGHIETALALGIHQFRFDIADPSFVVGLTTRRYVFAPLYHSSETKVPENKVKVYSSPKV